MVSGILTPETSILVAVASRNLWFTLLRGVPFSLKGPADREERTVLLCLEKKLTEVPGAGASWVG